MPNIVPHILSGVHTDGRSLYTINLIPGESVYGEKLVSHLGLEYRAWNPKRSKLAAFILKGCKRFPFEKSSSVLYLGAAAGTTASHISDIAREGILFCVEISPSPFRKLVSLCEKRHNMIPILEDAHNPESYRKVVGKVDILYQDIAQRDQVDIFLKNIRLMKEDGTGFLMVKARSIDVSVSPQRVYDSVMRQLLNAGLTILESSDLSPYERDHMAIVVAY